MPKDIYDMLDEEIRSIAGGDKSALAALYHHVRTPVYTYSLSILKDRSEAEDALHDTVLEIWRSAPGYKSIGKPMGWVIAIARSICLMKLRERQRLADEPPDAAYLADDGDLTAEDITVIRACMETLGEDEREVVILHAVSGLRHRDIAATLDQPLSTVLSRYNRAIKKLRKTLEGALR